MKTDYDIQELGYDPHPELTRFRGTPIPRIRTPLAKTPRRWTIAGYVWWNGPPWTVLRNSSCYLWHVMDYASLEDLRFTWRDVSLELWRKSLDDARPGVLAKYNYVQFSILLGRISMDDPVREWPDNAHRLDFRMLAKNTREQMIQRHNRKGWNLPQTT